MEVVIALAGAAVGVVLGWFIARARSLAETQNQTAAYLAEQERNRNLATQLQELKADLEKARNQVLELTNSLASTEADYRNLEERLAERKNELTELQEKFAAQFKNLANDIFEDKSKRFTDQNKSNISELLKPLGEKITDFEKKVDSTHKDAIKENAALREQLQHIQKLNVEMTREAENLTRALKGDSQAQGAWGEFTCRKRST